MKKLFPFTGVIFNNKSNCKSWSLFLIFSCFLIGIHNGKAQTLYVSSGGNVTGQNIAVNIAENAAVTSGTTPLVGATASVIANFVLGQDVLGINGSTSGTDGTIAYSYNATNGVLTLSNAATAAQYQETIRKITYTNTSASPTITARVITISLNAALPYSVNGHFYEFITSAGISWTSAKTNAESATYFGLQGYLATITTAGENSFCYAKLVGQGWIAASDAAVENEWRWQSGPETGLQFWQGAVDGYVVGGMYNNWAGGEPNNAGDEDYAHFLTGGQWNDLPVSVGTISGYVVEYGGMAGDPTLHISDNVTVNFPPPANPTSVTASANTICNGFSTQLTANGIVGTVYWYTGSCGTTGSFSSSNPVTVSPTTTTTYYARNYNNAQYSAGCASVTITVNQPSFVGTPPTVASLQATGTAIKWYAAASGGSPLETTATVVSGNHYYASQTVNGQESTTRLDVVANYDPTPCKPTGSATQSFSAGSTVANLSATGSSIRWYAASSGGTALPTSTVLINNTHYWATQTVSCTESATRFEVVVTIN